MIDIYRRLPSDPNFSERLIDITDPLEMYIQQMMTAFGTTNGEVLDVYGFGADLEEFVFALNYNEYTIRKKVLEQINDYCSLSSDFETEVEVKFLDKETGVIGLIDVFVDGEPRLGIVID